MFEIGGYIELDERYGSLYHDGALALNCGRAALEYLIRSKKIKKLYIPYYCCESIVQPCYRCEIEYEYYHIDKSFRPIFNKKLEVDERIYIINYYGQIGNDELLFYRETFGNIIVDNAQAYFQLPLAGVDTLYTCRKFFGVSDGAFLYTDGVISDLERDESFERIRYILGRYERSANEFYKDAVDNNAAFRSEPLKAMSKLTQNLLRGIDYTMISKIRRKNFIRLEEKLGAINSLNLVAPEGAFMYPLYIEDGNAIRKKLQCKRIYVPTLWPDVFNVCSDTELEYDMAKNLLPLPIDQRYGENEMDYLIDEILKEIL